MLISGSYQTDLRRLHSQQQRWGTSGNRYAAPIYHWAKECGAKGILDYGAGKGSLKHALGVYSIPVAEYDPGVIGKDSKPAPADCVVSTDVLEHIEPEYVDATLAYIAGLTKVCGWHLIALYKAGARNNLSDGRNAHLSLFPPEDWMQRINTAFTGFHIEHEIVQRTHPKRLNRRPKPAMIVKLRRKE